MAVLDKGMKQRMVGALVLVALAVIFLPMLFTREDEMRQVHVEPAGTGHASLPEVQVEPVAVPEPQACRRSLSNRRW
jgi:DedD protein